MRQGYVSAETCVSKLLYEIAMCMCVCVYVCVYVCVCVCERERERERDVARRLSTSYSKPLLTIF
jgi:hypothetical protein